MSRPCASEIATYYRATRDDSLPTENDILWASNGSTSRDLVAGILKGRVVGTSLLIINEGAHCLDEFSFRIVNWRIHGCCPSRAVGNLDLGHPDSYSS